MAVTFRKGIALGFGRLVLKTFGTPEASRNAPRIHLRVARREGLGPSLQRTLAALTAGNASLDSTTGIRVRGRALLLSLALAVPTVYWIIYVEVIKYAGYPTTTSLFYNVVAALFLVRIAVEGLRLIGIRGVLDDGDIRVVYVVLALVSAGASLDFTQNLMGIIAYPAHYATPENGFAEDLLPWLPTHLIVAKGPSSEAFWLGDTPLKLDTARGWIQPLSWWFTFCILLALAGGGTVMLFHRRWSEAEHLTYPILEVPAALSDMGKPLFGERGFLLGFLVAAGIETLNSLSAINPVWPEVPVRAWHPPFNLAAQVQDWPYSAIGYMPLSFYPFAIGQGLLLPTELSFSCWFFYLQWQAQKVLSAWLGWSGIPNAPFIREQSFGGFIGLALFTLWVGRRGWLREVRAALGSESRARTLDGRVALVALAVGWIGLIWFSVRAGMGVFYAVAFFAIFFAIGLAVTRIRAEMGLPVHDLHFSGPTQMIPTALGSELTGKRNYAVGQLFYWFNRAYRSHYMPHQAEGFRFLSGSMGLSRTLALFVGSWALGVGLSFYFQLRMVFDAGGAAKCVSVIPQVIGSEPWNRFMAWLNQPTGPDGRAVFAMAAGMLVTYGGMALSTRVTGWPIHPVGYAVSSSWAMERLWAPLMVAWAVKVLVARYGGGQAYRRLVPLAVGLVVGDFVSGSFWNIYGMWTDQPIYRFWD